jgi:NADPH:quinone reductase-like Zn-dependent oxidoreductase
VRAVTIAEGKLVWAEHRDPVPGNGEVLVQVRGAALNSGDLQQLAGRYPAPAGAPVDIPGLELAGEVVDCGPGVRSVEPGRRVMAVVGGGAQAELAIVPESHLMPVPAAWDWDRAGSFPEVFATAYDALFTQGNLTVGERLCVHGAAGGVGLAAVQLAVAAGASVVATVRNGDLRPAVAELGVVAIAPEDFPAHGPYDVVLELIGAPNIPHDIDALAQGGRLIVIGANAGAKAEVNLFKIMLRRAIIRGSTLRSRPPHEKAQVARLLERHVLPLVERGAIDVLVDSRIPMSQAATAYEQFAAGGKLGKIVLLTD